MLRQNDQCWPGLADLPCSMLSSFFDFTVLSGHTVLLAPVVCMVAMLENSCNPHSAADLMENFVVQLKQGVEET